MNVDDGNRFDANRRRIVASVPSITVPTAIAFFIVVGSAVLLRQRYSWLGVVLHIYGQIAISLSLFVMLLALVLALAAHA